MFGVSAVCSEGCRERIRSVGVPAKGSSGSFVVPAKPLGSPHIVLRLFRQSPLSLLAKCFRGAYSALIEFPQHFSMVLQLSMSAHIVFGVLSAFR